MTSGRRGRGGAPYLSASLKKFQKIIYTLYECSFDLIDRPYDFHPSVDPFFLFLRRHHTARHTSYWDKEIGSSALCKRLYHLLGCEASVAVCFFRTTIFVI